MMMRNLDMLTDTRAPHSCNHSHCSRSHVHGHENGHGRDRRKRHSHSHSPFAISFYFPASPRVDDGGSNNSTQALGSGKASALTNFDFGGLGTAGLGDEKRPKRRKTGPKGKACPLDLSEVPMNLAPIPSDKPGSASRFKGVSKHEKKWQAQIKIPSEGGMVHLGTFDSEEEAGIMYARARYKYPVK